MTKDEKQIVNYAEFWDYYVAEHSEPLTRYLHFIGTLLGVVLLVWIVRTGSCFYFLLCFFIG